MATDAKQMPIYHDHDGNDRRVFVGVEQSEIVNDYFTVDGTAASAPRETGLADLPEVRESEAVTVRAGTLDDGVGRSAVVAYLDSGNRNNPTVRRHSNNPTVHVRLETSPQDTERVVRAVQLVNAALPYGSKIQIGLPNTSVDPFEDLILKRTPINTLVVDFVPRDSFLGGSGAAATTLLVPDGNQLYGALIQFNIESNSYRDNREGTILLAHELVHALGLDGHVAASFASIMKGDGSIHHLEQGGVPQPFSLLYSVDREALRALYGQLDNGDEYADLGPWTSEAHHVAGNMEHVNFGVALRNGYAEPWAHGLLPNGSLADNLALSGVATWAGTLLGFSGTTFVAGDANIGVDLGTLAGYANFTALEQWADTAPRDAGTGTTWGNGELVYTIAVQGNTFKHTGGDEGALTGVFTGKDHEGAGGTLERHDLTAAFGAIRQ